MRPRLVSADRFVRLHAPPPGGDYAFGWVVGKRADGAGKSLTHDGSNTMFYARILLSPARDLIVLVATNVGGDDAQNATGELTRYLVARYGQAS